MKNKIDKLPMPDEEVYYLYTQEKLLGKINKIDSKKLQYKK
jgi:hypothetical protein